LVQPELDSQGVSAQVELEPNLPPILADRVEVQQVLMNLLVNSVRALVEAPAGLRRARSGSPARGPPIRRASASRTLA